MIGWCRCLTGRSGPEFARRRSGRSEHQRAVALVDLDRLTVLDLALQDQVGERVLQIFLYRALQRPRAIDGIIADAAEPWARGVRQVEPDLAGGEQFLDARDLDRKSASTNSRHQWATRMTYSAWKKQ